MADAGDTGDRRQGDRRAGGEAAGDGRDRRGGKRATSPLVYVVQAVVAVVMLLAVIVLVVRTMHPVYATRGKLGEELRKRAPEAAVALGVDAGNMSNVDKLMATAKFQEEKRNFYEDVMRLRQVDSARADSIATYAVREAYVRGISPAIIFGVMLTENSRFISKAQSNVGAVGLMQVYPKVWLTREMTKMFGRDLVSDSTNVKYGVFILSHYFNPKVKGGGTGERDWATALLRYNGCVRGTNTPRCHTYPNKVQNFVERQATSICDGRTFYDCIAKPFIDGLFKEGKLAPDDSSTKQVVAKAASSAEDSVKRAAGGGATVVAAGEVMSAPVPLRVPPVVVTAPDSTASGPAAEATPAAEARPAPSGKASAGRSGAAKRSAKKSAPRKAAPKKTVKKPTTRKKSRRTAAMPAAPRHVSITLP